MTRQGLVVVISAPSGTGKGAVLSALKERNANMRYSISVTTRKPREGEQEGVNYFYRTIDQFEQMIKDGQLLEWDKYVDNYYGTPMKYIEECTSQGNDVFLEITVEGALKVRDNYPDCVLIFMIPPSYEVLRQRIIGRGTEAIEVIEKRLAKAKLEIKCIDKYDYVIINDDVEEAANEVDSILFAEKLRYKRNKNITDIMGL